MMLRRQFRWAAGVLVAACCALSLASDKIAAAEKSAKSAIASPSGSEIISRLESAHPRLLASSNSFDELKARVASDPLLTKWAASLRKEAEGLLEKAPSKYEIPDGLRLLATSRRVLDRVYTLALMYRLEGRKEFADRAYQELEAAAAFPDWNPRHFLDTAEMTHAFAIGYDWLFGYWNDEQRAALKTAIIQKGLTPALQVYRAKNSWARARHNWNQVCNGGIGMGALAVGDLEPQLCGEILAGAIQSLPLAMAEFAPDGAWAEGPGYWNYATSYNVLFLAALQSVLKTDFGLSALPGFRDTGLFPIYLTGPLGRTFNYADGGDRAIRAPQMFWLARQFDQPLYAWYQRQHAAPNALDLLWATNSSTDPKAAGLPFDKYFRNAEVACLRSEWENPKALFVGFKAGDNKANHSHLDVGDFVLDGLGARWAVDLGADDYNLPGYFGSHRWEYYRLRAEGQNTLVINPGSGPDQDPSAATHIVRFGSAPERAFAIADLSPAYKKQARKVMRGIAMLDRKSVVIEDEITADAPAEVWWFMHTPAHAQVEDDGKHIVLKQVGVELHGSLLSPPGARFELMDAAPLASSPHPENQAKNETVKKLAIKLSGVKESRIAVVFSSEPVSDEKVVPLEQW